MQSELAKRYEIEGSMVEVYGVGVLIQGENGIGKSETVLELIKKGHIIISDDKTQIYQSEPGILVCEATPERKGYMSIKDLGLIDVLSMFGIGAMRQHKNLQLIVELTRKIDASNQCSVLIDTCVPKIQIEVESGRNIATLVETAALNYRLKQLGYNAEADLEKRTIHNLYRERED